MGACTGVAWAAVGGGSQGCLGPGAAQKCDNVSCVRLPASHRMQAGLVEGLAAVVEGGMGAWAA